MSHIYTRTMHHGDPLQMTLIYHFTDRLMHSEIFAHWFKLVKIKLHGNSPSARKRRWPYRWFSQHEPQLLTGDRRAARCGGQCVGAAPARLRAPLNSSALLRDSIQLPASSTCAQTFLEQCRFDTNTEITQSLCFIWNSVF